MLTMATHRRLKFLMSCKCFILPSINLLCIIQVYIHYRTIMEEDAVETPSKVRTSSRTSRKIVGSGTSEAVAESSQQTVTTTTTVVHQSSSSTKTSHQSSKETAQNAQNASLENKTITETNKSMTTSTPIQSASRKNLHTTASTITSPIASPVFESADDHAAYREYRNAGEYWKYVLFVSPSGIYLLIRFFLCVTASTRRPTTPTPNYPHIVANSLREWWPCRTCLAEVWRNITTGSIWWLRRIRNSNHTFENDTRPASIPHKIVPSLTRCTTRRTLRTRLTLLVAIRTAENLQRPPRPHRYLNG